MMKLLMFLIATVILSAVVSIVLLTSGCAAVVPKRSNRCMDLEFRITLIAWNDPDSFDLEHLRSKGLKQYMCGVNGYSSELGLLCSYWEDECHE